MVRIGTVWDSTTEVLAGRAVLLAPIAALAFFLPAVGQSALGAYAGPSTRVAAVGLVYSLLALAVTLWGQLAVIAVASHPETTRAQAQREALGRVPAYLLVLLVLIACAVLLLAPIAIALVGSGYDFAAAAAAKDPASLPSMASGARLFAVLYTLALIIGGLWVSARLFLIGPVVLNERRGIGAIARSVALTRGLSLKLIGVALLFGVVFLITALAVQSVVGLLFRLALGPAQITTARFMAALAGAVVSAAFTVVVQVFAARLYVAVAGGAVRGGGMVEHT